MYYRQAFSARNNIYFAIALISTSSIDKSHLNPSHTIPKPVHRVHEIVQTSRAIRQTVPKIKHDAIFPL